jgi:heme-degrading monooxygenase HmoA
MAETLIRIWNGWTRRSDADAYQRYLSTAGFVRYTSSVAGNRGVYMMRRELGDNTEFCVISLWDSWEAIETFAGEEPEEAMFFPEEERFLLGNHTVSHFKVFAQA